MKCPLMTPRSSATASPAAPSHLDRPLRSVASRARPRDRPPLPLSSSTYPPRQPPTRSFVPTRIATERPAQPRTTTAHSGFRRKTPPFVRGSTARSARSPSLRTGAPRAQRTVNPCSRASKSPPPRSNPSPFRAAWRAPDVERRTCFAVAPQQTLSRPMTSPRRTCRVIRRAYRACPVPLSRLAERVVAWRVRLASRLPLMDLACRRIRL